MFKRTALTVMFILTVICFAGCIYSHQNYGPARATVGTGTDVEDLVQTFGAPDQILKAGNSELYVYRVVEGRWIVVFGQVQKSDFVVTVVNGRVTGSTWVRTGEALSVLAVQTPVMEME